MNLWAITLALCSYESGNRPLVINYSDPTPAIGYCQVRMIAARDVHYMGTPERLLDKNTNLSIAHRYLKKQLKRYKGNIKCALDSYNKGRCVSTESKYVQGVYREYRKQLRR